MGYLMARNIAQAGFPLTVFNRTRAKAEALAQEVEVAVADSVADVAQEAEIIITMLADDEAVKAVYLAAGGLLETIGENAVLIDMSTISPETVRELYRVTRQKDASFLDAPVSGSTPAADAASLMIMVGGEEATLTRAKPVLERVGSTVIHVGPVTTGATMKLAVNSIIHSLNEALSEALVLSERAGIQLETAYEVIANSAAAAPVVHYRRPLYEQPDAHPVSFALDLAKKDVRLALELAAALGSPLPQAEVNYALLEQASESGFGQKDMASLLEYLRTL
jgi:3-hydroxyisobutyrate dehydrogenase-like beta-hydroxyacid dehydrogenase